MTFKTEWGRGYDAGAAAERERLTKVIRRELGLKAGGGDTLAKILLHMIEEPPQPEPKEK